MTRLTVQLATRDDEAALRALVARSPVPGRISLAYEREPDYFSACETMGDEVQVLLARDESSGEVVGVASRAERSVYLNGEPTRCSYLGQLRVDERYRGRWLVSRGFKLLEALEHERPSAVTIATIVEGSAEATGVLLEKPRRGFPRFREIGRLRTLAIAARRRGTPPRGVARADEGRMPEVVSFLASAGRSRQLFPVPDATLRGDRLPSGLAPGDFLVLEHGGAIRGVLAIWDQSAVKQTVVRGYQGALAAAKPWLNLAAWVTGAPRLPTVGERVRFAFASFVAVERDDAAHFATLLDAALAEAARRGLDLLVIGHADGDPLLPVSAARRHVAYRSRIFGVTWNQEREHARFDGRPIYLDPATL
jgi:hypothetical protein